MVRSGGEVAARVVGALLDLAEERAAMVDQLGRLVRRAVEELDPECLRDTDPTWWRDLPAWYRLDAFDRFRCGFDQIKVMEAQAGVIVLDLRGMLALRPVGTMERPVGYSPARAHAELMAMGVRRGQSLAVMARAERSLRPDLTSATSSGVRAVLRTFERREAAAHARHVQLNELLAPVEVKAS